MTDHFDIDWGFGFTEPAAPEEPRELDNRAQRVFVKNEDRHFRLAKDLQDLCGVPAPGEQWVIVTEKAFNAYACLKSLLNTRTIDEMYLAIYRINAPTVTALTRLMDEGGASRRRGSSSAPSSATRSARSAGRTCSPTTAMLIRTSPAIAGG